MRFSVKNYNIQLVAILMISFTWISCEKTEKIEDYPVHKSQLVTNCFFNIDSMFRMNVFKSLSPLDNAYFSVLKNPKAYVKIYENNSLFDSLTYHSYCNCYKGFSNKKPQVDRDYYFEAFFQGFNVVKSSSYIPDTILIQSSSLESRVSKQEYYHEGTKIVGLNVVDNSLSGGQYLVITPKIFVIDSFGGRLLKYFFQVNGIKTFQEDYEVEVINNRLFISNFGQRVNKVNLTLKSFIYNPSLTDKFLKSSIQLQIDNHTKDGFDYLLRHNKQIMNADDPFAEPVPISNNIINGYGVFSGYQTQLITIKP
jgi:hypothetical protein